MQYYYCLKNLKIYFNFFFIIYHSHKDNPCSKECPIYSRFNSLKMTHLLVNLNSMSSYIYIELYYVNLPKYIIGIYD